MLHMKRTNLEKVPGFEIVKQIGLGFHLCGSPKAEKQFSNGYSDRQHSIVNSGDELQFENEDDRMNYSNYTFQP